MKITGIIIFSCCCMPPAFAQELKGVVSDTESAELLAGVRVENKTRKNYTATNNQGTFSIPAIPGDTVQFSLVGYYARTVIVEDAGDVLFRRIALSKDLVSIDTVVVTPGLTAYQRDSLERRAIYGKKVDERPAKFKLSKPHPLYGGSGAGTMSFNGPLSSFFQKRSKKYKRLKAFQERFKAGENQMFTDTRYNAALVTALTGLEGASLSAFMNACPIPYDFARTATDLEVKMWIRYNYRLWSGKQKAGQK